MRGRYFDADMPSRFHRQQGQSCSDVIMACALLHAVRALACLALARALSILPAISAAIAKRNRSAQSTLQILPLPLPLPLPLRGTLGCAADGAARALCVPGYGLRKPLAHRFGVVPFHRHRRASARWHACFPISPSRETGRMLDTTATTPKYIEWM